MQTVWVITYYAGQIIEPEDFESKPVFGSELALLEVFDRVGKTADVTVFISKPQGYNKKIGNITWRSEGDYHKMLQQSAPNHVVISRYISSMCTMLMPRTSKIWLWCHDITPHSAYQGQHMTPALCRNMEPLLSGVVTVGDSQKDEIILPRYKLNPELFTTIKNGIDVGSGYNPVESDRAPMSFIYCSGTQRGLWELLKMWPMILNKWPFATLQIFHSLSEEDMKKIQEMKLPRVHPMGRVNQATLFKKMKMIDYWLYPCTFFETCCTTALEMQYYGPICITNTLGALKENNKGILVDNKDFSKNVMDVLEDLEQHPEKKREIRQRQYDWAKEQTWDKRAEDWVQLLS